MTTTSVKIDKYTIQHEDGANVRVLRNDLPWLESDMLVGHKMLIAVADEIETLRTKKEQSVERKLHEASRDAAVDTHEAAVAALQQAIVQPVCAECDGTRVVSDGQITHSEGGVRYENGSIVCIKDCPSCTAIAQAVEPTNFNLLTYSKRLEMFRKASDERATDYESYMQAIDDYESAFKVQAAAEIGKAMT